MRLHASANFAGVNHLLLLVVFLFLFLLLARQSGACSRRPIVKTTVELSAPNAASEPTSANSTTTTTSLPTPTMTSGSTSGQRTTTRSTATASTSRAQSLPREEQQPCPAPLRENYCLNDGTCFIMDLPQGCLPTGRTCLSNCKCRKGWMGARCGDRAIDNDVLGGDGGGDDGGADGGQGDDGDDREATMSTATSTTADDEDDGAGPSCDPGGHCEDDDESWKGSIESATVISGSVIFIFFCVVAIFVAWNWAKKKGVVKKISSARSFGLRCNSPSLSQRSTPIEHPLRSESLHSSSTQSTNLYTPCPLPATRSSTSEGRRPPVAPSAPPLRPSRPDLLLLVPPAPEESPPLEVECSRRTGPPLEARQLGIASRPPPARSVDRESAAGGPFKISDAVSGQPSTVLNGLPFTTFDGRPPDYPVSHPLKLKGFVAPTASGNPYKLNGFAPTLLPLKQPMMYGCPSNREERLPVSNGHLPSSNGRAPSSCPSRPSTLGPLIGSTQSFQHYRPAFRPVHRSDVAHPADVDATLTAV